MIALRPALFAAALLASVGVAGAFQNDRYSAGDYLTECRDLLNRINENRVSAITSAECATAVVSVMGVSAALREKVQFCAPAGVTPIGAASVVVDFIEASPDLRRLPYALAIAFAFRDAWPCPTRTPDKSPR